MELPKTYNPKEHEDSIYRRWEESGLFNPDVCIEKGVTKQHAPSFSIVLPPPNVTGTLHIGHAMMLAIQDALIRYHRMKGDKALWVPGTDHAAIATQSKVEGLLLEEEGKSKYDLGREEFLKRVEKFAQDSHDTIVNQIRKMGSSIDWSREAYTLDESRHQAVYRAFKDMYTDGLIIQKYRTINWSVAGQSTLSDDEVEYKERDAKLYTFKYSKDFPITIATTRPETKLGDTAVAVHPDDKRYKDLIGTTITVDVGAAEPLNIKVIGDQSVDPNFGTGALGVTPAHSHVDYDMYVKHDLEMIQVIGEDGKMTEAAGKEYAGLTVDEAREKFVHWLEQEGLLESVEDIKQNVGVSDRYKDIVEVLPKKQWFVAVNQPFKMKHSEIKGVKKGQEVTLKQLMQHVVNSGQIEIIPERFSKTYFHWIDNLRDWCISRQIWYGHRIPVWYKGDEIYVGEEAPAGKDWKQDPDTLDTWFSSGLWTFSTLGWPEDSDDFKTYHPTQLLETAYDILFFWVARMILMSTYHVGQIPFEKVYLHGLVRDDQGRKMSKSLGNVIDPLVMIDKFGTDAVRLSLLLGNTPGNDSRMSEEKIEGFRNFTNKLWNISRFILLNIEKPSVTVKKAKAQTLADEWILSRLTAVTKEYSQHVERYEFSLAGEKLRDFTWNELADWYLEVSKLQMANSQWQGSTQQMLNYVLVQVLTLWHPYMPFVTEAIWREIDPEADFLMIQEWPGVLKSKEHKEFEVVRELVTAIRSLRAEYKVEPAKKVAVVMSAGKKTKLVQEQSEIIKALARLESLEVEKKVEKPEKSVGVVVQGIELFIKLEGLVDLDKEKSRIEKEIEEAQKFISISEKKLGNKEFVDNAPKEIVQREKDMMARQQERLEKLEEQLTSL